MHLDDVADPQFAAGGLGARVQQLTCRVVILPSDPERHLIDFDDAFWEAWMSVSSPFNGRQLQWGSQTTTTTTAGARSDRAGENLWDRYAAVHHSGALDLGMGRACGWRGEHNGWTGCTYLVPVVATVWESCHVHLRLAERYGFDLPWELSIAIPQTHGTVLGRFGEGWAEPESWDYHPEQCPESGLLFRREVNAPTDDWPQATAFSIGVQLENAFGSTSQRFRKFKNHVLGDFDLSRYR